MRLAFGRPIRATLLILSLLAPLTGCGSGGGGSQVSGVTRNVTERYPVMVDLNYRYQLANAVDPAYPVAVNWYTQTLTEGVDYVLNKDQGYLRLLNSSLPPDSPTITGTTSLKVTYRRAD